MNHHSMSVDVTRRRNMKSHKTAKRSDFDLGLELLLGVYLLPPYIRKGLVILVSGTYRKMGLIAEINLI